MRCGAVALLAPLAAAAGLRDAPFQGSSVRYLDGTWTASTQLSEGALAIPATVPGDLITDLQKAGQIGDPLFEMNFKNSSIWDDNAWNFTTTFDAAEELATGTTVLVFDGVKMGATVSVNGKVLGTVTDQFLRYTFPLPASLLQAAGNTVVVAFSKDIKCEGRWMACTGGWDWAPYTTTSQEGAATFSKGIWKSVYLAQVETAALSHVVPHTFYNGAYAASPLSDGSHGGFNVTVRAHFWAPAAVTGSLKVTTQWGESAQADVSVPAGDSNVTVALTASAQQVKLWWPAGTGDQHLYNLTVTFAPSAGASVSAQRRIGFRTFAVVTGNDTDPAYVKASEGKDGTSDMGMMFRVNGAAIMSRGANMIPMEELEGRQVAGAYVQLVRSVRGGGMNTLRVWGGGIFLPDAFYDTCDEEGIILYHDMQYAQRGHSPAKTSTQAEEFRHQVRRLSHHPSISLWDGCNECHVVIGTSTGIYATFVLTIVAEEDQMRSIWPSCPANGWKSGVERLTSRPNGSPLGLGPAFHTPEWGSNIETHGPYQHATMWAPEVNSGAFSPTLNPVPLKLKPDVTGPGQRNVFASEFGTVVMSSFESMSPLLAPEHWALHGGAPDKRCKSWPCDGYNPMAERNYGCDNVINKFFGADASAATVLNTTGEVAFKRQLYQCMLGQALEMKSNIEGRRSQNQFGILVWQLNEIWPTGGWGSLEYGTPVAGQVLGGRWKPLQYLYKRQLYADVMCACSPTDCFVKNDGITPFKGKAIVTAVDLSTGEEKTLASEDLDMAAGAGTSMFFKIDTSGVSAGQVVTTAVLDASGATVSGDVVQLTTPQHIAAPNGTKVEATVKAASSNGDISIDVTATGGVALYVVLTTAAHGRFSDNAFLLKGTRTVAFMPFMDNQEDVLRKSLRVEHLADNLVR
eukprot:TRINITY_DN30520_c0_g1_i1.p1 TRINITY_DN30520_c0_g1~~TRINITY_DN30520_c0_g1_i1.p1  ORF type:complete len:912 (+),score=270.91 TRINITY_DN30520_c0_g1_i1:48-2783(+)